MAILAQLIEPAEMSALSPDELREMLLDVDEQIVHGSDEVDVELSDAR